MDAAVGRGHRGARSHYATATLNVHGRWTQLSSSLFPRQRNQLWPIQVRHISSTLGDNASISISVGNQLCFDTCDTGIGFSMDGHVS